MFHFIGSFKVELSGYKYGENLNSIISFKKIVILIFIWRYVCSCAVREHQIISIYLPGWEISKKTKWLLCSDWSSCDTMFKCCALIGCYVSRGANESHSLQQPTKVPVLLQSTAGHFLFNFTFTVLCKSVIISLGTWFE